jgi:hypothetical protein
LLELEMLSLELCRYSLDHYTLSLEPWRFTVEHEKLSPEPQSIRCSLWKEM